jgi:hypothetical protein
MTAMWTEDAIKDRLKEAADTLKRLPPGTVRQRMSGWPDVVRQAAEAYGYGAATTRLAAASPAAISRLDETLAWLFHLDIESRRIAWARASGVPWRKLEDVDGRSHVTLRRVHDRAIRAILRRLNPAAAAAADRLFAQPPAPPAKKI